MRRKGGCYGGERGGRCGVERATGRWSSPAESLEQPDWGLKKDSWDFLASVVNHDTPEECILISPV